MTFDPARRHKIESQEVNSHKNLKMLTKSWRCATFSARIQNMGWTQLESTLKIIRVNVENYSFGCILAIGDFVKRDVCIAA